MGYHRAGFDVTGVDIQPQKRFPFKFIQADALEYLEAHWREYDFIAASPPCQAYSLLAYRTKGEYPKLIKELRDILISSGKPYVIENVPKAPLLNPIVLCGSMFNLNVRRHRIFESNFQLFSKECQHKNFPFPIDVTGTGGRCPKSRKPQSVKEAQEAMGIDWMIRTELNQAIPPAYTEFIGRQIIELI